MSEEREKCLSCQYEAKGFEAMTPQERQHWIMWGCTCDPENEANAIDYLRKVTE